jgi:hypothetical protein
MHSVLQDSGLKAALEREGRDEHVLVLSWQNAPWVIMLLQPQPALLLLAERYQANIQQLVIPT